MKIYFVATERDEQQFFERELGGHDLSFVDDAAEVGEDAEGVSIFIYARIDAAFLAGHPHLRWVATRSTGHDHIDIEACRRANVAVASVASYGENTVAEHTFALILAVARKLRASFELLERRHAFSYEATRGFELNNKTLGVIGSGRIGLRVIRMARAFDMHVLAFDHAPQPFMTEVLRFRYLPLPELLAASDVITLHIPLSAETHHIMNRDSLALCKPGAVIINTARGRLIDTDALIEALDSGHIAGAGLDVIEEERVLKEETVKIIGEQIVSRLQSGGDPELRVNEHSRLHELHGLIRHSELLRRPNVVFTPHVAFNSVEAMERINRSTLENIRGLIGEDEGRVHRVA